MVVCTLVHINCIGLSSPMCYFNWLETPCAYLCTLPEWIANAHLTSLCLQQTITLLKTLPCLTSHWTCPAPTATTKLQFQVESLKALFWCSHLQDLRKTLQDRKGSQRSRKASQGPVQKPTWPSVSEQWHHITMSHQLTSSIGQRWANLKRRCNTTWSDPSNLLHYTAAHYVLHEVWFNCIT